ncbi:MAG: sugar ABC transporter permease [Bacteroidales bacterium]|nr:sugar ABC transporter permease [Bacteroidales bacterium]
MENNKESISLFLLPPESLTRSQKIRKFFQEKKTQKHVTIILFSVVPLLLLILFTYLPFGEMVKFSFYKMKYLGKRTFIGWQNYQEVFHRSDILKALFNSLYYMGAGVIQLSMALFFACILSFKTPLKNFFKATLFFPYLVCALAVGYIFGFFYSRGLVLDSVLGLFGLSKGTLPYWLKDRSINNWSIAATSIWRYQGQSMVLFIGAIQAISPEFFEASSIDGATRWQQFQYIILPSLKPIVILNFMLMVKGSLSAFEGPYVLTYGMNGTATTVVLMHQLAHEAGKVGLASAMAVILLIIILAVTALQNLIYSKFFKGE